MDSEEKLAFVRTQMMKMWADGKMYEVSCPYCLSVCAVNDPVCCGTLARAVNVIIEAQQVLDRIELAQRIVDKTLVN